MKIIKSGSIRRGQKPLFFYVYFPLLMQTKRVISICKDFKEGNKMTMSTKEASAIHEKRVAQKLNESLVIGSGATPFYKGDVNGEDLLVECKTKMKPSASMKIEKAWHEKAKQQAQETRKDNYVLAYSFGDGEDYVASEIDYFAHLYKCSKTVDAIIEYMGGLDYKSDIFGSTRDKVENNIRKIIKEMI